MWQTLSAVTELVRHSLVGRSRNLEGEIENWPRHTEMPQRIHRAVNSHCALDVLRSKEKEC